METMKSLKRTSSSKNMRIEQKGRFTITEIVPGSPSSAPADSPLGAAAAVNLLAGALDSAVANPPSELLADITAVDVSPAVVEDLLNCQVLDEQLQVVSSASTDGDPVCNSVDFSDTASIMSAPATLVAEDISPLIPPEQMSPTTRREQRPRSADRRVKRKGRFTIIELASDSPRSKKSGDDPRDLNFSTTPAPPSLNYDPSHHHAISRSYGGGSSSLSRKSTDKQRVVRSMTRFPQKTGNNNYHNNHNGNGNRWRGRMRSESPLTMSTENRRASIGATHHRQQQQQQHQAHQQSASYGSLPVSSLPPNGHRHSMPPVRTVEPSSDLTASANSAVRKFFPSTESVPSDSNSGTPPTSSERGQGRRHVPSRQKLMTISAAQYRQQQQTIASLIRQQNELKKLVGILQEQQQQLMNIPMHLHELQTENTNTGVKESTLDTLAHANESLQTLLRQTEQEASDRAMEVECLNEENDELRHRCAMLETRYIEERRQSFTLEEELRHFRMMALNQEVEERATMNQEQA